MLDQNTSKIKWKANFTVFLLLLILLNITCSKQPSHSKLITKIDAIVYETMQRDQVVGTSIGVMKDGEVIIAKGYGYADLENNVKATEHTVYRLASVTKQFTALAIMLLVERGELNLDDEIVKYLPDYPTKGYKITIERLLNHTSGIKGFTEMEKFWKLSRNDLSHKELIDLFSAEPFEFTPGEKYQYNNSAYYLLGVIIEKVTDQSYAEFLSENIWKPLGMHESYYLDNSPIIKNRAEGYEVRNGEVINDDLLSMKPPFSAGALGSSVTDLLRWQSSLLDYKLISRASYERMIKPGTLMDETKTTYGFGLFLSNMGGHYKIEHEGAINGFRTQLSYYPEDNLTVIVLCNTGSANPASLESSIARMVLEIPELVVEEIVMSEDELHKYEGTYNAGRSPWQVSVKDGRLSMFDRQLLPIDNHIFVFDIDIYKRVSFKIENGKAVSLTLEREGQITNALRYN